MADSVTRTRKICKLETSCSAIKKGSAHEWREGEMGGGGRDRVYLEVSKTTNKCGAMLAELTGITCTNG